MRLYKVIYNAIEDVEAAMKGMLDPIFEEKVIGHAEVRQIFKASGVGNIAGSYVLDGVFERGCKVRVKREGEQIFEGDLASLKRFKDDVKEVKTGYECGLVLDGFNDIQELDIIEAYKMEVEAIFRTSDSDTLAAYKFDYRNYAVIFHILTTFRV